jgi:hypothetical protein
MEVACSPRPPLQGTLALGDYLNAPDRKGGAHMRYKRDVSAMATTGYIMHSGTQHVSYMMQQPTYLVTYNGCCQSKRA